MNKAQYLEAIEGTEFRSVKYEGIICIENGAVISQGEVLDIVKTKKQAKDLFNEMILDEFGTTDPRVLRSLV